MAQPQEKDFLYVKEDLENGRISPAIMRAGLISLFFASGLFVGIACMGAFASNTVIGWENLSFFWRMIFILQGVLFLFQLILIFFIDGNSNWSQLTLNVSYVVYWYKFALDPFIMISIFAMDSYVYEEIFPIIAFVIVIGFLFHFYLVKNELKSDKVKKKKRKKANQGRRNYLYKVIPPFFLLAILIGYLMKNDLFYESELLFLLGIITLVFFLLMVGTIEFVIGAYCLIRFPSFRVDPPSTNKRGKKSKKGS